MAAEPPSNSAAKPADSRGPRNTAIGMGTLAAVLWLAMGPDNPLVALLVTFCTINIALAAIPLAKRMPARWYRVPRGERWLHLALGVPVFGWLLERSGWNRAVALPMRHLKVTLASLRRLQSEIQGSEGAHAIAFVAQAALGLLALAAGHATGALWLILPAIVVHLYPVLLQRWMTLRVAPLLCRAEAAGPAG